MGTEHGIILVNEFSHVIDAWLLPELSPEVCIKQLV